MIHEPAAPHGTHAMPPSMLLLADGRFPTGGYAHSAGVEQAVAIGDVVDEITLERYLRGRLDTTGRVDAAFAAHTCAVANHWRQAAVDDVGELVSSIAEVDGEYAARIMSPYLRSVSVRLGRQILRAARAVWHDPILDACGEVHQPVAFGATVAAAGGTSDDAAALTLHHLGATVTTAAVRLLGLDPFAAAAVQAATFPMTVDIVGHTAAWTTQPAAALPAGGGMLTEILGEIHGARSARLFVA